MSNTKLTLDGLLKDVYSDEGLQSLTPDFAILYNRIPFKTAQKVGRDFVQAVALSRESAFTYGAGLATIVAGNSAFADDAKVRGSALTLESTWSYDAAAAMTSSKEAFISGTEWKMRSMMEAMAFRIEAQILHGSDCLGVADSSQDSVTAVTNTSQAIIPITSASWSPALWSGTEGAYVSFFRSADGTTASAAAGSDSSNTVNKFEVAAVDVVNKTITVKTKDGTEAAALVAEVEARDYNIQFYGALTNEMVGLHKIATNTGTLYGIAGGSYSMFKGNTFACGGNLSLKKIYQAVAMAAGRGLNEAVMCIISPASFAILANDEAALRQYVTQVKKADRGVQTIEFVGPTGTIEVVAHPMQKEGQAVIVPTKKLSRVGACDVTLKRPGQNSDEMVYELATQTGFGCRAYSEQSIFLPAPCMCTIITGVTNA